MKGDLARSHAAEFAWAASSNLITTRLAPGRFGRKWLITARGLELLRKHTQ